MCGIMVALTGEIGHLEERLEVRGAVETVGLEDRNQTKGANRGDD